MMSADEQQAIWERAQFLAVLEDLFHRFGTPAPDESSFITSVRADPLSDFTPMTVDLPNTPVDGEVWVVYRLTLHGICAINPPNAQSPVTGLCLIPYGQPPETLAFAQLAGIGFDLAARGVPLPAGIVTNVTAIPNGATNVYP